MYAGSTQVSTGTLALVSSGSIGNSPVITIASGAILDVGGRSDAKLTLTGGQTLGGNGTVNGSLLANAGATVSPGTSIGALMVTNTVTLQGTTLMELNKSLATNDVIKGAASIAYGGTLSLTNLGGTLAAGDSFKLFYATTCSGAFTNIVPPMAASGLVWDTASLVSNGTLNVAIAPRPVISSFAISGGNLLLSGTNGVPNAGCYLLGSTNLMLPVAQWTRIATNTFGANGSLAITNAVNLAAPQQFYMLQLP